VDFFGGSCFAGALFAGVFWRFGRDPPRRTPHKNSAPSRRQFLAIAENCSRCHFTVSSDPTVMGVLTRRQAPDGDVSSRVAGARFDPVGSSQKTSATAHTTVLGSMLRPSMPSVSALAAEEFSYDGEGLSARQCLAGYATCFPSLTSEPPHA